MIKQDIKGCEVSENRNTSFKECASADCEEKCRICYNPLGGAKYCCYCGTKRVEDKFEAQENFTPCIYGSPPIVVKPRKKWLYGLLVGGCVLLAVLAFICVQ